VDWDKLRVFHAAAEAGSFTHAGEALGLSQSAVSRQVSGLELDLQAPLFHRHARGLILTEQGEVLFRTVRDMVMKLDAARTRSVKLALAHGCHFVAPPQGLFGWVDVGVDTDLLAQRMHDNGYLLAPGSLFHADRRPGSFMRVNFASTQDDKFWRALAKTRQALL
jgi:DNA-binding transcriptional LysR family regulator